MKKIVVAGVVLLLVLVVAPWGVGRVAEKRVNDGLDQLVKEAPYLSIAERKWTRGWFRSEQEVTFEVLGPWTRALNAKDIFEAENVRSSGRRPNTPTPTRSAAATKSAWECTTALGWPGSSCSTWP